jgi:preprotein translocase subunit SecD
VVSAPEIQQAITTGESVITGRFTAREARDLATALGAGELPVPLAAQAVAAIPAHDVPGHSGIALVIGIACLVGLAIVGGALLLRPRPVQKVLSAGA